MAVVIEAADQPVVPHIGDGERIQTGAHGGEEIGGFGIQIIAEIGGTRDHRLVAPVLRIEDAQRVAFEPQAAVLGQALTVTVEIGDQRRAVGGAACRVAEGVEFEGGAPEHTERLQYPGAERDHLHVAGGLGDAEKLDADLVELAKPPLLRALIAEHGAMVKVFQGQVLGLAAGNQHARDACRAFGPESDFVAALVGEAVHLLGDDVRGVAQGAPEDIGELEDRGGHLMVAVARGGPARGFLDVAVSPDFGGQDVPGATYRLQCGHGCSPATAPRRRS